MKLPRFAVKRRVAAIRGLTDRPKGAKPAYPKVSRVQPPRHDTSDVKKRLSPVLAHLLFEFGRSNPVAELAATARRLVSRVPSDNLKQLWEISESKWRIACQASDIYWMSADQMWERACSRMRWVSQYIYRLTRRLREQARSHILISICQIDSGLLWLWLLIWFVILILGAPLNHAGRTQA